MKKDTITPFWQCMPRFFLYPLRGWPLAALIAGSLSCIMLSVLWVFAKLLFFIGLAFCFLGFMRFAFSVLEQTALGRVMHAQQDFFGGLPDERRSRPWKLLGVLGFMLMAMLLSAVGGRFIFFSASVLVSVALPASIMILAMTGDINRSISPPALIFVMRRIGSPYFGLCGLLLLVTSGFGSVLPMLQGLKLAILWLPLSTFVMLYMVVVLFYMMGYVVYQYHEALELEVEVDFAQVRGVQAGKTPAQIEEDRINEEIADYISQGRLDAAVQVVDEQRQKRPDRMAWQMRYFKMLLLAGKSAEALAFSRGLVRDLLSQQRLDDALDLLTAAREVDAGFLPLRAGDLLPLAETAWRRRQAELAMSLIKGFDTRFPTHVDAPGCLYLGARILSERFRRDELSVQFLRHALKTYPSADAATSIRQYLDMLVQLHPHLRTSAG